jgi:hypothetical protein
MSVQLDSTQFANEHSRFKLQETSVWRRITEFVAMLLCNFWRSAGSYLSGEIQLASGVENQIKTRCSQDCTDTSRAIRELRYPRPVGPTTLQIVCEKFQQQNPEQVQLVSNFMFNALQPVLPSSEQKDWVLVPVVLKGVVDHIVAVLYNRRSNCVEVFDSKGLVSNDYPNDVRCNQEGVKLADVVRKVAHTYGDVNTTVIENTAKHQWDGHNCGIYVLDYYERRLKGDSHETIVANPLSYAQANQTRRAALIQELL